MLPKILLIAVFATVRIDHIRSADDDVSTFMCNDDSDVVTKLSLLKSGILPIIVVENDKANPINKPDIVENIKKYLKDEHLSALVFVNAQTCGQTIGILNSGKRYPVLLMLKESQQTSAKTTDMSINSIMTQLQKARNDRIKSNTTETVPNLIRLAIGNPDHRLQHGEGSSQQAPRASNIETILNTYPTLAPLQRMWTSTVRPAVQTNALPTWKWTSPTVSTSALPQVIPPGYVGSTAIRSTVPLTLNLASSVGIRKQPEPYVTPTQHQQPRIQESKLLNLFPGGEEDNAGGSNMTPSSASNWRHVRDDQTKKKTRF